MIFLELHYLYDNPINLSSILLFLLGCLFVCPYSSILWRDLSSFVVFYGLVFCMPLYYFKFFFSMKVFFFLKKSLLEICYDLLHSRCHSDFNLLLMGLLLRDLLTIEHMPWITGYSCCFKIQR